jgi:hypothetical protein
MPLWMMRAALTAVTEKYFGELPCVHSGGANGFCAPAFFNYA